MQGAADPMRTSTSARINALLAAVIDGDVSHLLESVTRANVNYADPRYGLTLLQWAVSLSRLPTVTLLLARGASVLPLDGNGFSALHRAVWCADVAVVSALLFMSPLSRVLGSNGAGHRHTSGNACTGDTAIMLRRGEQVDDEERDTMHDYTLWLASGLDASRNGGQQTATGNGIRHQQQQQPLRWRPSAAQLVNLPHEATGRTPLMLAAVRGALPIVRFLLFTCHADARIEDRDGFTALELAALCGHAEMVSLFLAAADGDGSGRAFPRIQQRAEDYVLTAKTVRQQQRLNEVNRRVCEDLAVQSTLIVSE